MDRSGSVPSNASFSNDMPRNLVPYELRSAPACSDDECGLVLGLGYTINSSSSRCISLPSTSSAGSVLSFGSTFEGSCETMQVSGTVSGKLRSRQAFPDGTTSGISKRDIHKMIQGCQNFSSSAVSCTFNQTGVSENKLDTESYKCDEAIVTKSLDMDPDILQLGLSRASPEFGKLAVVNPFLVDSQSNTALMLGSRGYMPSLLMTPRSENSGHSLPQIGSETISTSCGAEQCSSSKSCKFPGCQKGARGASGLCISHGGGNKCQKFGCSKGAKSRTVYCKAHGGGRRCEHLGCTKGAEGRTDYCIGHGGGRRCSNEGCTKAARGRSGLCIKHGGGKRCQKEGCTKSAEGYSFLCISHGGGRRCQQPECTKGAQGSTMYCKAHGGGKRCAYTGCNKGAEGSTPFCKGHGGGKRCMFGGSGICPKSVHGGTQFCVAHGGGKRCAVHGCTKSARGRTDCCVKHGGGKRCKSQGCGKSAQGSTDFCKAHGGGKRCLWGQEGSVFTRQVTLGKNGEIGPCDRFARGKTGLCAAHSSLVQDHRSHGGNALRLLIEKTSEASNCIQSGSSIISNVDHNINKDVIDVELRMKIQDVQEDLILPGNSVLVEAPSSVNNMNIDTQDVVANEGCCGFDSVSIEDSYVPLPEGRVHGGNLMSMFSRNSRPGHVGFVSFLVGANEYGKKI